MGILLSVFIVWHQNDRRLLDLLIGSKMLSALGMCDTISLFVVTFQELNLALQLTKLTLPLLNQLIWLAHFWVRSTAIAVVLADPLAQRKLKRLWNCDCLGPHWQKRFLRLVVTLHLDACGLNALLFQFGLNRSLGLIPIDCWEYALIVVSSQSSWFDVLNGNSWLDTMEFWILIQIM